MRFKCSNITIIVIVLIILLLCPMFLFHKQSPYMLMEGLKNKEGLVSKTTSKPTLKEGFSSIKESNNPFSMLFFKDTKFKPQCCPSSYSNSMGCACINKNQYQYLITRGGNNVPFSQW